MGSLLGIWEGLAATKVLTMVGGAFLIVTDSTLVLRKVKAGDWHQMDWNQAAAHIGKLVGVHCVKARPKQDEAALRAASGAAYWHRGLVARRGAIAARGLRTAS